MVENDAVVIAAAVTIYMVVFGAAVIDFCHSDSAVLYHNATVIRYEPGGFLRSSYLVLRLENGTMVKMTCKHMSRVHYNVSVDVYKSGRVELAG